MAGVKRADIKL